MASVTDSTPPWADETACHFFWRVESQPIPLLPLAAEYGPPELQVGEAVEYYGESGAGKTAMLMELAIQCILPVQCGGAASCALIIDTEGGFNLPLLAAMLTARLMSPEHVLPPEKWSATGPKPRPVISSEARKCLRRLKFLRCYTTEQLLLNLHLLSAPSSPLLRLILIDTISVGAHLWLNRSAQRCSQTHTPGAACSTLASTFAAPALAPLTPAPVSFVPTAAPFTPASSSVFDPAAHAVACSHSFSATSLGPPPTQGTCVQGCFPPSGRSIATTPAAAAVATAASVTPARLGPNCTGFRLFSAAGEGTFSCADCIAQKCTSPPSDGASFCYSAPSTTTPVARAAPTAPRPSAEALLGKVTKALLRRRVSIAYSRRPLAGHTSGFEFPSMGSRDPTWDGVVTHRLRLRRVDVLLRESRRELSSDWPVVHQALYEAAIAHSGSQGGAAVAGQGKAAERSSDRGGSHSRSMGSVQSRRFEFSLTQCGHWMSAVPV